MRHSIAATTAALALVTAGCVPMTTPTGPTGKATTTPTTVVDTERQLGFVTNVATRNGVTYLDVDYIEMLNGVETAVAYVEDGNCDWELVDATPAGKQKLITALRTNEKIFDNHDCSEKLTQEMLGKYFTSDQDLCGCFRSPGGGPYDRNRDHAVRTLPLSPTAEMTVVYDYFEKGYQCCDEAHPMTIDELRQLVEKNKAKQIPVGQERFYPPFSLAISGGMITELHEEYRP